MSLWAGLAPYHLPHSARSLRLCVGVLRTCDSMPFPYGGHVMRTLLVVLGLLVAKITVCLGTIPKRSLMS